MCKTIKQKVHFKLPPATIYDLFIDSKKHSGLTKKKTQIDKKVGGPFKLQNGFINGINVDLKPGKRIVLAWRQKNFPEGIFSMVTLDLREPKPGNTELILTHRGVPKILIPNVERAWRQKYWLKIKEFAQKEHSLIFYRGRR